MKYLKNIIIIFILSVVITFTFDFFIGGISGDITGLLLNVTYGLIIGLSISLSGVIARVIFNKFDIEKQPIKTYTLLLISVFLYISIDVFLVNAVWYNLTQGYPLHTVFTNTGALLISLITIFIGIIIFFILLSKSFMSKLINAEKEKQLAKDESAKFQYETLKNQINPHFLFNSLNVLSSLIYKDVDKADEFTIKLAKMYRYILDHQDDDIVTLESEIKFIEKYAYLQRIRFNQNFKIEIGNWEQHKNSWTIPMALQLIIENVFKHNELSTEAPMTVKINFEDGFIVVRNPLNPKKGTEVSHQLGLKNIEKRYQLLTNRECQTEQTKTEFIVRLPLLEVQAK